MQKPENLKTNLYELLNLVSNFVPDWNETLIFVNFLWYPKQIDIIAINQKKRYQSKSEATTNDNSLNKLLHNSVDTGNH